MRRGVRQAVEALQPGDLAAVVRAGAGPGALRDFTNDKTRLLAAADQIRWNPKGRGEPEAYGRVGRDPIVEAGEASGKLPLQEMERLRTESMRGGHARCARPPGSGDGGIARTKGRRAARGQPPALVPSRIGGTRAEGQHAVARLRRLRARRRVASVERAARAGVVINAIDTRGLSPLTMTAADSPKFETDTVGPGATPMSPEHVPAVLKNATRPEEGRVHLPVRRADLTSPRKPAACWSPRATTSAPASPGSVRG